MSDLLVFMNASEAIGPYASIAENGPLAEIMSFRFALHQDFLALVFIPKKSWCQPVLSAILLLMEGYLIQSGKSAGLFKKNFPEDMQNISVFQIGNQKNWRK